MTNTEPTKSKKIRNLFSGIFWIIRIISNVLWFIIKPLIRLIWWCINWMRRRHAGGFYSLIFHGIILVALMFNLSWFKEKPKELPAITIELLPMSEVNKAKPDKPAPKQKNNVEKKAEPTPPKPPKVKMSHITNARPKAVPLPKPKKKEEKKPKKKEVTKKKTAPAPLLKTLEKEKPKKKTPQKKAASNNKSAQKSALSAAEINRLESVIYSQLANCWSIPAGARGIQDMYVEIDVKVDRSGNVKKLKILNAGDYSGADRRFFNTVADSALRAVYKCQLRDLPLRLYDQWKHIIYRFEPPL